MPDWQRQIRLERETVTQSQRALHAIPRKRSNRESSTDLSRRVARSGVCSEALSSSLYTERSQGDPRILTLTP